MRYLKLLQEKKDHIWNQCQLKIKQFQYRQSTHTHLLASTPSSDCPPQHWEWDEKKLRYSPQHRGTSNHSCLFRGTESRTGLFGAKSSLKKEAQKQSPEVFTGGKEALAQVSSCKFCEISKNTFSYKIPLVAASASSDTSLERWVAFCRGRKTRGLLTLSNCRNPINILKLKAAKCVILT